MLNKSSAIGGVPKGSKGGSEETYCVSPICEVAADIF